MAKTITMQDIADRAGVTKTTVSLALRGDRRISGKARERIQKLAEEMGYRPNPLVASLMTQVQAGKGVSKGTRIALLAPPGNESRSQKSLHSYGWEVYEGIRKRAEQLGYGIDIIEPEVGRESFDSCVRVMHSRGIRGVVLPPFQPPARGFPAEFDCGGFAVVAVGYSQNIEGVHRVAHSQFRIAYGLTQQALARGYRRIGLHISPEMNERTGHKYPGGFFGALSDMADLPFSEKQVLFAHGDEDELVRWVGAQKLDAVLTQYPQDYHALLRMGFSIPDDLGFGLLSTTHAEPFMSGCFHDPKTLASAAVDLVTAQMNRNETGKPSFPKTVLTPEVWVEGETL
jgi:LacI family transcriptional regulator